MVECGAFVNDLCTFVKNEIHDFSTLETTIPIRSPILSLQVYIASCFLFVQQSIDRLITAYGVTHASVSK